MRTTGYANDILRDVLNADIVLAETVAHTDSALGTRFVLQGGTQNNRAMVKAEVDFIRVSFNASRKTPKIVIHEHCGKSGAIGAAQEALRLWINGRRTTFIGFEAVMNIRCRTTRDEDTRCRFCKNNCLRTFIGVDVHLRRD